MSVNLPTTAAGRLFIVFITDSSNRTASSSGWNVTSGPGSGASGRSNILWKFDTDGSLGSTFNVTWSSTYWVSAAMVVAIDGVDPAFNVSTSRVLTDGITGVTSSTSPAATSAADDSLALRFIMYYDGTAPSAAASPANTSIGSIYNSSAEDGIIARRENTGIANAASSGTFSWTGLVSWQRYGSGTILVPPSAAPSPPTITSATITGTSQVGQTLTANVVTDQDPVDSIAYQWQKAATDDAEPGTDISGETSSTLALTYAELGSLLDAGDAYVRYGAIATKNSLASDEAFSAWQQVTIPSSAGLISSPLKSPFLIA